MDNFDVGRSLKLQSYLNNQNISQDDMNFVENLKFNDLLSDEEFYDIYKKVERYKTLEKEQEINPSADNSVEMQEIAQDVMYSTGKPVHSISVSNLKTNNDLEQVMLNSNTRSKNDLFVEIDYNDYSNSSNFVKCKVVSHDKDYAYGISAGARMIVTKSGKIITTKNSLYMK